MWTTKLRYSIVVKQYSFRDVEASIEEISKVNVTSLFDSFFQDKTVIISEIINMSNGKKTRL